MQQGVSGPLWAMTLAQASSLVASQKISPLDLVDACLERITEVDAKLHTYIHVAAEHARAEAKHAADEIANGRCRGALHGLPFAVKDNYDVAGMPATANSKLRLKHIPQQDAGLVRKLRHAGAILLGKLATWEYGTGNGGDYFDLPFPSARNPWDTSRFTGGSSTGAGASVAAGTTLFALGSDTTGSVRLPAAATGVVGVIPTPGSVSLEGILPNCYSLDIPGPFTWTVEDNTMVLDAILDPSPVTALRRRIGDGATGMRVAVVSDEESGFPRADESLRRAFDAGLKVLADQGAGLSHVRFPVSAAECFNVSRLIGPAESAAIHEDELRDRPEQLGFALRDKLMSGAMIRAVDYIAAQRRRFAIAKAMQALMRNYDALVTFGALHVAPRLGVEPEMTAYTVDTMLTPINLASLPAMVQCTGFSENGLPLHWQIVANPGDEASMLRLAHAYEQATTWRARRPVL